MLLLIGSVSPVVAPVVGGQLLQLSGWRLIFLALTVLSAAVLLASFKGFSESLPDALKHEAATSRQSGPRRALRDYSLLLHDRQVILFSCVNALVFAAMFVYISGSPFVLESEYGLSAQQYSITFAVNGLGLVAAAQLNSRLVRRRAPLTLLKAGVAVTAFGAVALVTEHMASNSLWPLLAAFFVIVSSLGIVMPNAVTLILENQADRAGSASGLLGCVQFLLGGLAAPVVSVLGSGSETSLGWGILTLATGAALATIAGSHLRRRPNPGSDLSTSS